MKYLGIDYGEKNVGIAVSDDGGNLAFAKIVLPNDKNLLENVVKICNDDKVDAVVLGESLNFAGKPNPIMKDILAFKNKLEKLLELKIYLEPEFLTSAEAGRIQGKTLRNIRKKDRIKSKIKPQKNDASAAALILKTYLSRNIK
ncbi:MAG: Holliday junction resolvase RuvX [Patescibacteria group bacterium]